MPKITKVTARQILDSRSFPTIEVSVTLDSGHTAYSSAPSGGVVNTIEAVELRDNINTEYFGLGVSKAVNLVNTEIHQALLGLDPLYQNQVDQVLVDLDGTPNKSRIGGNSLLATSQAVMKVAAASLNVPLFVYVKEKYQLTPDFRVPTPIFNLINGGRHGSGSLDFQEFQVVPASHLPYRQALRIGAELFLALERVLEQKGAIRAVGLEGGFSPNLATNTDALEILFEACKNTNYTLSKDAFLGIDVSPQNFAKGGRFIVRDKNEPLSARQMITFFKDLHSQYRVFAFEDALMPDAWADWKELTSELGRTAMIIADDLVATNKTLLMKAIEEKACNALVIKPNRAGTVSETVEVVSLAKQAGWQTVMSHRSSETNDDFLADFAVGLGTEYVKFGATSRGERVVKYNRLLRIQDQLEEWSGNTGQTPAPQTSPNSVTAVSPPPLVQTTPETPMASHQTLPVQPVDPGVSVEPNIAPIPEIEIATSSPEETGVNTAQTLENPVAESAPAALEISSSVPTSPIQEPEALEIRVPEHITSVSPQLTTAEGPEAETSATDVQANLDALLNTIPNTVQEAAAPLSMESQSENPTAEVILPDNTAPQALPLSPIGGLTPPTPPQLEPLETIQITSENTTQN